MPSPADDLISSDIDLALRRIRNGGLVAIPTETVYGLAADAEQPDAVARVFAVKDRPTDHPLIIHLAGIDRIDGWVDHLPDRALLLAEACWPGPLTMLVTRGSRVADSITGGRDTVGLRVPSHPVTQELLRRHGGGLAAPSANRYGRVSPTTAQHVFDDLAGHLDPRRDLILDGGPCRIGVESTIVDLTVEPPQVLRSGAISADDIERLTSRPVAAASGPSRAAGMTESHYAPRCEVVLAGDHDEAQEIAEQRRAAGESVELLDRTDDLVVAAQRLYADLRAADRRRVEVLVVVLPPAEGIGHALRDRLTKAAAH